MVIGKEVAVTDFSRDGGCLVFCGLHATFIYLALSWSSVALSDVNIL